ncbi:MAG TPA: heavy metal translocating P-type ATPase [Arenimonas sp.]|uniref:heavy metal translocating P-type ATPase n=1 Tax=Arenimonas sp. TaxID=1872635 RepID=UPI002D7FE082|nr:heavy metal translocating P-type ATPase [Arenimonas sp.]HEU0153054.1 heavy metal translocating P-type ATPase [Arenimonas sp.]
MNPAAGSACFHCGEPLPPDPPRVIVAAESRAVCCHGCGAAAQWIADAGLDDYYRLRSQDGARVDEDAADFGSWDRADVQAGHVVQTDAGRQITVVVEGMRCAACAWLIDRALVREPGVVEVGANAITGRVRIGWDPVRTPLSRLLSRLAALGYRPHLAQGEAAERERRRERNRLIARLGVAVLGATQAMMFAEALYLDTANEMAPATRDFFRWITFLVSTPVVFFSGWPFLAGMAVELRHRRPGMDTLVASSVLLAYFASLFETLRAGRHVWYDAAVMFVLFLLAARFLELMARRQASARLDTLARAQPALAWRRSGDGREQVPVAALQPGDVVLVGVGEAVPADGELLEAAASFDESLLTGESVSVARQPGDALYAGSVCREQAAALQVQRTGSDTRLSQLTRAVEQAQAQRPRVARLADAVATRFVSALFLVAALVFFAWWQFAPERAFEVALAVLVVSCPCALSLAVPAALATAHGTLARMGVLALGADALESLARADTVVMDKTGTLSTGRPVLASADALDGGDPAHWLAVAAALEQDAGHPIAAAFARRDVAPATAVRAWPGLGIEGVVDGEHHRLGRADFAAGREDDGALWLGDGRRGLARFTLADPLRADAGDAIAALRALGVAPRILSGDGVAAVAAAAQALGVEAHAARQSPEQKLAAVRALQADGHRVLMLGDGINDAPVLAGADVSMAMADGAPLAHRAADLVLTGSSLVRVPQAIVLARRTQRVIRQNLGWALAYNLVALPFAALGWVTPGLAALGMAASSLVVTANALRLGRFEESAR